LTLKVSSYENDAVIHKNNKVGITLLESSDKRGEHLQLKY